MKFIQKCKQCSKESVLTVVVEDKTVNTLRRGVVTNHSYLCNHIKFFPISEVVYLPMYYAATIYDAVKIVKEGDSEITIDELIGRNDHFTCVNHNTNNNLTRIGNFYFCKKCKPDELWE